MGQNICESSLTSYVMGLCWQIHFWLGMCGLLRMHSAMAGLPFEAVELWLLWAKNAVGTRLENMSLAAMYWSHQDTKTIINDTQDVPDQFQDVQNATATNAMHLSMEVPMSFNVVTL